MAVSAGSAPNVQIAITLEDSFMNALPDYFTVGNDMKLHHDPRKVNVFAHKRLTGKHIFADSYGEVLTFETPQEFVTVKERLLANPIFLHVRLEKEKNSGNTRYITRGSFIVFINTQHPIIQQQLAERLDQVHELVSQGKNVALEIRFGTVLKNWFKLNFEESWASYSAEDSNFCITNYSQRFHECYNPLAWIACFPCCLLGAPFYCIHRHVNCIDLDLTIHANVQYTAGVSEAERRQLTLMLARAYVEGLNAGNNMVSAPPQYPVHQQPPPPYSTVPPNNQQPAII